MGTSLGEESMSEKGPQRPHFHSTTSPLSTAWPAAGPWLRERPTFAISPSPLTPARGRAQAAALLTLRPPLADCTGQGAAWLLSHVWGGRKQVTGASLGPEASQHPRTGAALAELPPWVEPRGEGVTQHQLQRSDGAAGKGWHHSHKRGQLLG